jgi:hypothetical protein
MADWLCQACNQKRSSSQIRECDKCNRVLCDRCRDGAYTCKDSKNGTAGCRGTFKSKS